MKTTHLIRCFLLVSALGLPACSNPLHNANDWPYKKGASVDYIPKEIANR